MSGHTPGPWLTVANEHGECHVMDARGFAIADMAVDYSSLDIEQHIPNARLISTTPELLKALEAIVFQVRQGKVLERDACITTATDIITKATGKQA